MNGNLTSDGTNTYVWNARDHLVSVTGPGLTASFQYDAFGKRISKTVNSTTVSYLYDGANLVQEQSGGSPSANILAGALDEVFTRTDVAGAWSPLFDGLGSTLALADSTGTVQTQYTYEPFGKTTTSGSSNGNTSQYTGRENDGTGLYYFRARYYSPSLQRFVSEDPIGLLGGINLYGYVDNNPISYRDPFGLDKNNPDDDTDIGDALKDFVRKVDKFITDIVIPGAAMEPLVPILGTIPALPTAARTVANPVPKTMARVIPEGIPATTLGRPGAVDVFVTAADDIAGMNMPQIANRLGIPQSPTGFRVFEFPTPQSGVASPVFRTNPGFIGGGRTPGGAREFVIPNQPIPPGSTRIVPP